MKNTVPAARSFIADSRFYACIRYFAGFWFYSYFFTQPSRT